MISLSLAPGSLLFELFICFLVTIFILTAYNLIFFIRLAFYKDKPSLQKPEGISIVICARNAYHNLKENLPSILEQDYPDFEIVVVNYASDDDSFYLLNTMADQYPNLKMVEIKENLNFFSGKKFPLSIGIKSAKNDLIIVTEPDCRPASRSWLTSIASGFKGKTEVVLSYGSYEPRKGLLNKLARFDAAQNAVKYLSFALAGIPYTGNGRNMAYRKSLFYRTKGFISLYRLVSGDDLFVNKVARGSNTQVILNPEGFTIAESKYDFRNWFLWKKRKLFTPFFYRFPHQFLLGLYNVALVLFYLVLALLLAFNYNPVLIISFALFRTTVQMIVFYLGTKKLHEKDLVLLQPFMELCLLGINFSAFLSNLFVKTRKWN